MSFTPRTRLINPRLGMYFGIFASAFAALAILNLIFEQLGVSDQLLRFVMALGPVAFYIAIGVASITNEPIEYYAAGRRVPAVYGGVGLAIAALGGTGLVTLTGSLFLVGFDTLCILSGVVAGFVVMAVLLAPFLRKFGTFTSPSYLGRRFDSRVLRVVAAALLSVPTLLMLAAELRIGATMASWLTGIALTPMMVLFVVTVIACLFCGGMRSLTWSSVAASIAALLALLIPIAVAAVLLGYLPAPQLSSGPVVRAVSRGEAVQALPVLTASLFAFDLPGEGLAPIAKRFIDPFGSVGAGSYIVVMLTVMAGIASAPWLLPRVATAPGVYEARKSLGWATVIFGVVALTLATIAAYMRFYVLDVAGTASSTPPGWLAELIANGQAQIAVQSDKLPLNGMQFDRDSMLLALPIAAGMPKAVLYFVCAGIIAAALTTAGATALSLSNLLSEDILNGLSWEPQAASVRLNSGRILLAVVTGFGAILSLAAPTDPLRLVLWALVLTASTGFPVLVASVWWKQTNVFAAFASMATGFSVAVLVIVASEAGWIGLASPLAALLSVPASVAALIGVALTTVPPTRHELELVRDIRVPGGEILYDREMRLLRLKERKRS